MWGGADAYEAYVGRWSRLVARQFVRWLDHRAGLRWLDVGCGTGALTQTVLATAEPREVVGVDPAEGFLEGARARVTDPRVSFQTGDAQALPFPDKRFDAVVSGLALNFVPDARRAAAELARVTTVDGTVAAYVWDYAEGMAMMRYFWEAARALDPEIVGEGGRFPLCRPEPLRALWTQAGLTGVEVTPIEIDTVFSGFDDYWRPFLGGQGPGPAHVASLPAERRDALRDLLRERLPAGPDGRIALTARAWAVRGQRPAHAPT